MFHPQSQTLSRQSQNHSPSTWYPSAPPNEGGAETSQGQLAHSTWIVDCGDLIDAPIWSSSQKNAQQICDNFAHPSSDVRNEIPAILRKICAQSVTNPPPPSGFPKTGVSPPRKLAQELLPTNSDKVPSKSDNIQQKPDKLRTLSFWGEASRRSSDQKRN